jgi:hypothetical protein
MPTKPQAETENEPNSPMPQEFFTVRTFRTLGGSVVVAGVVATVISALFSLDPKIVGFVVCLSVAYVGLFLAKKRRPADYVVTFFNGFLIYFTLVGATSFYPYLNSKTAGGAVSGDTTNAPATAFRPWVPDKNLVHASQELIRVHREQTQTLNTVQSNVVTLEAQVRASNIPPAAKTELGAGLARNRNLIQMTRTNVAPQLRKLKAFGIQ